MADGPRIWWASLAQRVADSRGRHEAYDAFMRAADRVRNADQEANAAADASYYARIFEALGSIRLVGPDAVIDAAKAYGDT